MPRACAMPALREILVLGRVALDQEVVVLLRRADGLVAEVEDDVRDAGGAKLVGDLAADAAVAADDEVVAQAFDRSLPSPFGQDAGQDSAGDRLDDNGAGVGDDRQAAEHEHHRDDARAVRARDGVEPRERRRHDRAIERLEPRFVQSRVEADRAAGERDGDRSQEPEAPDGDGGRPARL